MTLSVIIPAYNALDKVLRCLNSLQAGAHENNKYIVQDDASPNVLFPACVPLCAAITYRNEYNRGFPGNCNEGAKHAQADVLFFVNQDVYAVPQFSRGWDTALLNVFDDPQVGVVGARLLFPNGTIQSVGGLFDGKGHPFHRCLGYSNLAYPGVALPKEVRWTTGAAFAVRRSLWEQIGGFDTAYGRGYFEDVDF